MIVFYPVPWTLYILGKVCLSLFSQWTSAGGENVLVNTCSAPVAALLVFKCFCFLFFDLDWWEINCGCGDVKRSTMWTIKAPTIVLNKRMSAVVSFGVNGEQIFYQRTGININRITTVWVVLILSVLAIQVKIYSPWLGKCCSHYFCSLHFDQCEKKNLFQLLQGDEQGLTIKVAVSQEQLTRSSNQLQLQLLWTLLKLRKVVFRNKSK